MKIAVSGLSQAGQQQLFALLSGIALEQIRQKAFEVQLGVSDVRDPRINKLTEMYKPKKTTYTKIEYSLLPDFTTQGPAKTIIFNELKNADEICWVARAESAEGDIRDFIAELILYDLMLVEKRMETIDRDQRRKFSEEKAKEKGMIELCKKQLEAEKPLSECQFSDDQQKTLRAYQFFTLKPLILVVNVPEGQSKIEEKFSYPTLQLSVEIEEEINQLAEADRSEFMKELGIDEPAIDKMTRLVFEGLGYISFFTVGEDEVRAWPVKKNALAAEAGGTIHSDIEKGFVRAELMKYEDLIAGGSEAKLKEQGKFSLKGRDYVVQDGDILSFRFSV